MKKLFLSIVALCATCMVTASEIVTLTVNGQGATKEIATSNALRSAIEQTFGVFVSANTQILNDALVKDEIATVSSGNIQSYKELSCVSLPNGETLVSLSATVAIGKLVAYAKSHGSSAEFAGQTFAMNMKLKELNKKNEVTALKHTLGQLRQLLPYMFEWKLQTGEPVVDGKNYRIPMTVTAVSTEASNAFYKTLLGTLKSLSLTPEELAEYQRTGMKTYNVRVCSYGYSSDGYMNSSDAATWSFVMRSPYCIDFLEEVSYLIMTASTSFEIKEVGNAEHSYLFKNWLFERLDNNVSRFFYINGRAATAKDDLQSVNESRFFYVDRCASDLNGSPKKVAYYTLKEEYHEENNAHTLRIGNLLSYSIQIVRKKKLPEPIVYRNNIFVQPVSVIIAKDRIGSISGFEVKYKEKSVAEVKYNVVYVNQELNALAINDHGYCLVDKFGAQITPYTRGKVAPQADVFVVYDNRKRVLDLNFKEVTNLVVSDVMEAVVPGAFGDCDSLISVTIPDNIKVIGDEAFKSCNSLTNATIGNGVAKIGREAFRDCTSLTDVTIGNSISEIGIYAFSNCVALKSITIPDSVTSVGDAAFFCCSSLTSVTIGNSITSIGNSAFDNCTSLTSVVIPKNVTLIGDSAFWECTSLKEVYCKSTTPPIGSPNMFSYRHGNYYKPIGCKIYVPRASVEAYKTAKGWSNYAEHIVGYDF